MENYYQILGVEATAPAESIKKAIREKRREWRNRANHPRSETRALAEQMTEHIAQAERTLLDAAARKEYDDQLAAHAATSTPPTNAANGQDWLAVARQYLQQGQPQQANYAAREATQMQPESAEAWYVRGQSSVLLNNDADAEFELSEAVRLKNDFPEALLELGDLYADNERWPQALDYFQKAAALVPDNTYCQVAVASAHLGMGRFAEATPVFEAAVKQHPEVDLYRFYLAESLIRQAQGKMSSTADNHWVITSANQLSLAEQTLSRLQALKLAGKDPSLDQELDEWDRLTTRAGLKRWHHSEQIGIWLGAIGFGFIAIILGLSLPSALFVLLGLAMVGGMGYLYYQRHHIQGWQDSRRALPDYVIRTGLQD